MCKIKNLTTVGRQNSLDACSATAKVSRHKHSSILVQSPSSISYTSTLQFSRSQWGSTSVSSVRIEKNH